MSTVLLSPQEAWTQKLLFAQQNIEQLQIFFDEKWYTWWHNPSNPNSLRLNKTSWLILGYDNIKNLSPYKFIKFNITSSLLSKSYIQLERYFTSPYYIKDPTTIFVVGEAEIMMLALHSSNLQRYLNDCEKNKYIEGTMT